jgi:Ohr subfamily peroxiredoxin
MDTPDSIIPANMNTSTQVRSEQHASEAGTASLPHPRKVVYTATVQSTGGRDGGNSRSSDGRLVVKHSIPGTHGDGTNPEQLFAAGWSACFLSAMAIAARMKRITFPEDATVTAEVDLYSVGGDYSLGARLNISLPGLTGEVAKALTEAGERSCPYSKAIRNNVDVAINLV